VATDYDKPRTTDTMGEPDTEPTLRALTAQRADSAANLGDDTDPVERLLDLPEDDLSGEELTVPLLLRQDNEFTCSSCYLVRHHSQLADEKKMVCDECAA
jgi:hypothetical protein